MDTNLLVESGRKLLAILDREGIKLRAAMWAHNRDTERWRLWMVPTEEVPDKWEFYRRFAEAIAKHRGELAGFDIGDAELVSANHPAISALGRSFHIEDEPSVFVSDNMLNGFYLPDGIILRMAV